ncbi:MAG TPA: hypothetical protein VJS64_12810 [Pyrinomonadaceae bacterium]|nr:hypothetical protein [Pyrinomonadaceae bacterium]
MMSNVLSLAGYQWVSYWRRLRRAGSVSTANQGIVLLILLLVVIKYLQLLHAAAANIGEGKTALLNSLLTAILVIWLFPVASGRGGTLSSRLLLHLPLSPFELFVTGLFSHLISPTAWLIVACSMAICYPLAFGSYPLPGIVAALLFIIASWQFGFAVSQLLGFAIWRKILGLTALVLALVAGIFFRNGFAVSQLNELASFNPATLVINAVEGKHVILSLTGLASLAAAATLIGFGAFRRSLGTAATRSRRRKLFGVLSFPGRLGGLIGKDVRYFSRLLDIHLGVLASVLCCFHLVVAGSPSADVVRLFILIIFLMNSALAFNLFGLDDSNGLDRYQLLPLSGQSTLLSKNVAFACLIGAQLLPVLALTLWRLGWWETLGTIVMAISLTTSYLVWGNWMSVTQPQKLSFYRFSSTAPALADVIGGLVFGSLPGVLAIYGLRQEPRGMSLVLVGSLVFFGVYLLSLARFGKTLERAQERLATGLL